MCAVVAQLTDDVKYMAGGKYRWTPTHTYTHVQSCISKCVHINFIKRIAIYTIVIIVIAIAIALKYYSQQCCCCYIYMLLLLFLCLYFQFPAECNDFFYLQPQQIVSACAKCPNSNNNQVYVAPTQYMGVKAI